MGALLFEVSSAERIDVQISATVRLVQVGSRDAGQKVWRALIIGGPKSGTIGRVSATGANVATPGITVVEVAADSTGQYLPIGAGRVSIGVARSN